MTATPPVTAAPTLRGVILTLIALCCAALSLGLAHDAAAQPQAAAVLAETTGPSPAESAQAAIAGAEDPAMIRDVISALSDAEARALLIAELDSQVAERQAARASADARSPAEIVADWFSNLGDSLLVSIADTAKLRQEAAARWRRFEEQRGERSTAALFGALAASLAGGVIIAWALRMLTRGWDAALRRASAASMWGRLRLVCHRFLLQARHLIVFTVAAAAIKAALTKGAPADAAFVAQVLEIGFWGGVTALLTNFVFSPFRPDLRLVPTKDAIAWFITWRTVMLFSLSAVLSAVVDTGTWSVDGVRTDGVRLVFWLNVFLHLVAIHTLWRARHAFQRMLRGDDAMRGARPSLLAANWHSIAVTVLAGQWLVVELLIANDAVNRISEVALNLTPVIFLALPLIDQALRAIIAEYWPDAPEKGPLIAAANRATQAGLMRFGRLMVWLIILIILADLWELEAADIAGESFGAHLASAAVELVFLLVVAYGLWELMNVLTDRQIAIERATLGVDENAEGKQDGEGGRGGTRLGTVMPLLRGVVRFFILLLTLLAVFGLLGVNVTPLLAGAGVVGLALGFGAQTLVRDILSGVFFLVDDAFRQGEYIEIGETRGTVESISIRSMQLRHHTGPLHTIPFGEIARLTNYSRDWVIMKLPMRVTYDTDVERLRKLIKALGKELMEDPEHGPNFLEPLKSQGVIQMDDSAMIVRVKFKCLPGDQWVLRKVVYARIRELFAREGIRFAHREVTVRVAPEEGGREGAPPSPAQREAALGAATALLTDTQKTPEDVR